MQGRNFHFIAFLAKELCQQNFKKASIKVVQTSEMFQEAGSG